MPKGKKVIMVTPIILLIAKWIKSIEKVDREGCLNKLSTYKVGGAIVCTSPTGELRVFSPQITEESAECNTVWTIAKGW